MWVYKSPIGKIKIIKESENIYYIVFDDNYYGPYSSAVAAADDVYTFSTGYDDWDKHCDSLKYQLDVPTDIYQWERLF